MITDKMKKRFVLNKTSCAPDRMCVASSLRLANKGQARGIVGEKLGVWLLIAGPHHDADIIDTGAHRLSDDKAENRTLCPLLVKKHLHGKNALGSPGRRDYRLLDLHLSPVFPVEHQNPIVFRDGRSNSGVDQPTNEIRGPA